MKGTTQLKELARSLRGEIQHLKGKLKHYRFSEKILRHKKVRVWKQWYLVWYKYDH